MTNLTNINKQCRGDIYVNKLLYHNILTYHQILIGGLDF